MELEGSFGAQAFSAQWTHVSFPTPLMHLEHMPLHIFFPLEHLGADITGEVAFVAVDMSLVAF